MVSYPSLLSPLRNSVLGNSCDPPNCTPLGVSSLPRVLSKVESFFSPSLKRVDLKDGKEEAPFGNTHYQTGDSEALPT